ncbi:unnamed protein product [Closterium sp. NIES-64]|nr:unnamed protein product [Closterium sp. NIES-64]
MATLCSLRSAAAISLPPFPARISSQFSASSDAAGAFGSRSRLSLSPYSCPSSFSWLSHLSSGHPTSPSFPRPTPFLASTPVKPAAYCARASRPPLQVTRAATERSGASGGGGGGGGGGKNSPSWADALWRGTLRRLASFPLAIGLLFAVAGLCAVGTLIEQGARPSDYMVLFPDGTLLSWQVVLALGFDHVYSSPLFLSLLLLLAASLAACTSVRQLPMLKVAQRWSFIQRPESLRQMDFSDSLERAQIADLATLLMRKGYQVFQKGSSMYAFKGLVGRLAPIGVHAALLLVMAGGCYSALGGFQGTTLTPQGLDVVVPSALQGNSIFARPTTAMNMLVHVNRFYIEYRSEWRGEAALSDLSVTDLYGRELQRNPISINNPLRCQGVTMYQTDCEAIFLRPLSHGLIWQGAAKKDHQRQRPLRCQGVTMYQTDWAISAVQLRSDGGEPFKLPMASLQEPGSSQKLFGTFLPTGEEENADGGEATTTGISILARDLQNVVIYDSKGEFVGVRRPGSNRPITVEGKKLVVDELIGSTGLELKMDPGVPYVYAGFGALMLTTAISYLSHSQVRIPSCAHFLLPPL